LNTETGEIKQVPRNEKLKPPWIPINAPNPSCRRCKGKGSVPDGNRTARRHNLQPMHYMPCPDCSGKKQAQSNYMKKGEENEGALFRAK